MIGGNEGKGSGAGLGSGAELSNGNSCCCLLWVSIGDNPTGDGHELSNIDVVVVQAQIATSRADRPLHAAGRLIIIAKAEISCSRPASTGCTLPRAGEKR